MLGVFAELGARSALAYLSDRVLSRLTGGIVHVRRYLFFVQPLGDLKVRVPQNMRVIPLPQDFESLPLPVPRQVVRQRLKQGSRCYVLMIGEEFAGYAWFQDRAYNEDEVRCTFAPRPRATVIWDYDIYIVPKYRATRAFVALWQLSGAALRELGFTHTASQIAGYNVASLRSHIRLGARQVDSALFVNVGPWQLMKHGWRISLTRLRAPLIRVGIQGSS